MTQPQIFFISFRFSTAFDYVTADTL